jgi:hypothetical protein
LILLVGFAITSASVSEASADEPALSVSINVPSGVEMSAWAGLRLNEAA